MSNQLVVVTCLVATLSMLSKEATAVIVASLRLEEESLAPYITSGYDVNLGDAIELLCPANLTGKHGLYHLFEDQYDNCSPPEDRNYVIGECTGGNKFFLLLSQLLGLENIPQYKVGRKYYYGLYNASSSFDNKQCASGVKFSVSIIDPNATSPTTATTQQLPNSNSTTVSQPPVANTTVRPTHASSKPTPSITSASVSSVNTRPPPTAGIVNSSPTLRVSVYIVTLIMILITALLL